MKRAAYVLAFAAVIGCGGTGATGAAARSRSSGQFGKVPTRLDGARWLSPAAADSEVLAVEAAATGDRIESTLSIPDDVCALVVARAAPSVQDLDLYAYGEDGTVIGSDERPEPKPGILICPPHPRRVYLVARIAAGHGVVALGAQKVEVARADRVARAAGVPTRKSESLDRTAAWPGLEEKIARRRRDLGGIWQDLRRVAVPADPRLPTSVPASVEADRCLDVLVVPSVPVAYLDLEVTGPDGRVIGRGGAHGRDRALLLCTASPVDVTIRIRPHAGSGMVAVAISQSAVGSARDLEAVAITFDATPVLDLSPAREKLAVDLRSAGYESPLTTARGNLQPGQRTSTPVDLPRGCSRVDLVAGPPVRATESWLWAADGSLLGHARGGGRSTLFACSAGELARIDTETLALGGPFAVELRAEAPVPEILWRHPLAASRLLDRMASRGVLRRAAGVGAPRALLLRPTALDRSDLQVPVGRCVDVTLALGPGATGAELTLIDAESGQVVEAGRGTASAGARACALDRSRTLRVNVEARASVGETTGLIATRMLSPAR